MELRSRALFMLGFHLFFFPFLACTLMMFYSCALMSIGKHCRLHTANFMLYLRNKSVLSMLLDSHLHSKHSWGSILSWNFFWGLLVWYHLMWKKFLQNTSWQLWRLNKYFNLCSKMCSSLKAQYLNRIIPLDSEMHLFLNTNLLKKSVALMSWV